MAIAKEGNLGAVADKEVGKAANRWRLNHEAFWGFIFISPWIIGFLLFILYPIVGTAYYSLTDFLANDPDSIQFVGLANYRLLVADPDVWISIWVTIRYGLIAIPIGISIALLMATLVNSKLLLGQGIFRTLFYMPQQIPVIVGALIWLGVMNSQTGWLNMGLDIIGINGPDWFQDENWVYPALSIIGLWGVGGTMLIYLAAMQGIPNELYDAAKVDGAGPITTWFRITLPMITPVIFYTLTLSIIGTFQYFVVPYLVSNGTGRPGKALLFYNLLLFRNAFTYFRMGYASAMAWLLFLIVMLFTILLFASSRYWVHYSSGEGDL